MSKKKSTSKTKTKTKRVKVAYLPHGEGLPLPEYQTPGAAGLDVLAAIGGDRPLMVQPGDRVAVPAGFMMELPDNFEAQIRPRSGLAIKHGLTVLNAPGTIDSDYRGEVQVLLINLGQSPAMIQRGDRIAQMVIAPVQKVKLRKTSKLSTTKRADGGLGSTGQSSTSEKTKEPKKPKKKNDTPKKRGKKKKTG